MRNSIFGIQSVGVILFLILGLMRPATLGGEPPDRSALEEPGAPHASRSAAEPFARLRRLFRRETRAADARALAEERLASRLA
jgi:hypothetical protein